VGWVFFPLDEQLALLPTHFSPVLTEAIVRLGTLLPFEQASTELEALCGIQVSDDTVRRLTEEAGAAQVALEQAALEEIEHTAPDGPAGPEYQQLSADGAMIRLVGGAWTEVRTLALGTIDVRATDEEHKVSELSYFSRRCSAHAFIELATLPTQERGTRRAGTVVAVMDGASWLQELVDEQRADAVRMLDFAHAASYLATAAQTAYGAGTKEASAWLGTWLHELKHGTPELVVAALRQLPNPTPEAGTVRGAAVRYLSARSEQLRYAHFRELGYPLGSGIVESACKLVVEARMKGAGMRWAPANVNPILALRGIRCSGRWEEAWSGIWQQLRRQAAQRRRERWEARHPAVPAPPPTPAPPPQDRPKLIVDGRPTADHPWHRDRLPKTWAHAPKL
jgi:hypothetical protein